jgi:hypothetical protein
MTKLITVIFLSCTCIYACVPKNNAGKQDSPKGSVNVKGGEIPYVLDTNTIAILPITKDMRWLLKDSASLSFDLSHQELRNIDSLLTACINDYNLEQNNTRKFPEYIDLKNYKRQYIPYKSVKGKKVYINCFCIHDIDDWKKRLVQIDDGGSCFFQLTADLEANRYLDFSTNGPFLPADKI